MASTRVNRLIAPLDTVCDAGADFRRTDPPLTHTMRASPRRAEQTRTMYTKAQELRGFLILTVFMAPALTFLLVAGYGFLVWMFQLVSGPPHGG